MKKILFTLLISLSLSVLAEPLTPEVDARYCGFVPRTNGGGIARDFSVLYKFKSIHPCPATGVSTGPCFGWNIDHIIPLACGGCDSIINLQWLPVEVKRCKESYCKDRYERKLLYFEGSIPGYKPGTCEPGALE